MPKANHKTNGTDWDRFKAWRSHNRFCPSQTRFETGLKSHAPRGLLVAHYQGICTGSAVVVNVIIEINGREAGTPTHELQRLGGNKKPASN